MRRPRGILMFGAHVSPYDTDEPSTFMDRVEAHDLISKYIEYPESGELLVGIEETLIEVDMWNPVESLMLKKPEGEDIEQLRGFLNDEFSNFDIQWYLTFNCS